VRQGKVFDLVLGHDDQAKAEGGRKAIGERVLANMVIEDFSVKLL
jgi:phosphoribosylformylglycinamidine synthase subunit PurS